MITFKKRFLNDNNSTGVNTKQKIASMRVANDGVERAVKLATDFNNVLKLDEAEWQLVNSDCRIS